MDCSEWKFDKKTPIYIQLYQKIKYGILSGQLPPGETVPSIRQMADILYINTNTAARSYRLLVQDGLIELHRGKKYMTTSNSDFIHAERTQEAKNLYSIYLRNMKALGFSKEESQTFCMLAGEEHFVERSIPLRQV